MRIGFDARAAFIDPRRGFGRVAGSLVEAMLGLDAADVVVFVPHGAAVPQRWYTSAAAVAELRRPRRGAFLFDGPAWRWATHRHDVDVLYLPAWGVPPLVAVPVVATFHDATPLRFPSPPSHWSRTRARRGILSLRRATLVHAVSNHAAAEATGVVGIAADRIRVVHWGVGTPFTQPRETVPPTHLLYVGGGDPHKNLDLLIDLLSRPEADTLPVLVVAGPAAVDVSFVSRLAERGVTDRVRLLPELTDRALAELYASAFATLLPSRNEGFGLPVLEAMACGCPVVVADAGALPEVAGDDAYVLPPDDVGAWLAAVHRLIADTSERTRLRTAGSQRAAAATWTGVAERMLAVCEEAARF